MREEGEGEWAGWVDCCNASEPSGRRGARPGVGEGKGVRKWAASTRLRK